MRLVVICALLLSIQAAAFAQAPFPPEKINLYLNGSLFEDVTLQTGIFHMGQGKCVTMADIDKDGKLDVYISVVYGKNKFYMNQGNMKFVDYGATAGIDNPYDSHATVFADFDNDGLLDLFVANNIEALSEQRGDISQPNALYWGDDEQFNEKGARAGVAGRPHNYSSGVTCADVNGDGFLDFFVAKGAYHEGLSSAEGDTDTSNSLFINNGHRGFVDLAQEYRVNDFGAAYGCNFGDYDNDGRPDLFVSNLNSSGKMTSRLLYHNEGNGKFRDVTKELGLQGKGYTVSSMWGDFNNDGWQDLFLANSRAESGDIDAEDARDSLFLNNGDGTFKNISKESGVADVDWNSRGCTLGDINNDGFLDIMVTNSRNNTQILINDGKLHFKDMGEQYGGAVYYGHGMCVGDLDNDGDLEMIVGNWKRISKFNQGLWRVFENKTNNKNWLKVDVEGTVSNRSGVMTKLAVYDGGKAGDKNALRGYREVTAGNGSFPGNPLQQHFGLKNGKTYDVVATFPSGKQVTVTDVKTAQTIKIVEK